MVDQEADSRQVTRRKDDEARKTPSLSMHREESAGSSAHPSRQKPDRTARSSKQPNRSARSSRGSDDKTACLEEELHEMKKQMGDMKNSLKQRLSATWTTLYIGLIHRSFLGSLTSRFHPDSRYHHSKTSTEPRIHLITWRRSKQSCNYKPFPKR
uniref:Uncharacterized protein n=1 Tax=Fagus sylvatica TaxID=28930 RepID=A0A2N9H937_FAGSY